jgi:hypothetical protein
MGKFKSRRSILASFAKGIVAFAVTSVFGPVLSSSCKKNSFDNKSNNIDAKSKNMAYCSGLEDLNDQEKALRSSLKYVDQSPIIGKTCDSCKIFSLSQKTQICGTCPAVPGPINPKGYCIAWIPRM